MNGTAWIVCAILIGAPAFAQQPQISVNAQNRTIAITAGDSAVADADVAIVHVGFKAYGADESSAYRSGSDVSNRVFKAMTDFGLSRDAIESTQQSLSEVPDYENQKQNRGRYLVEQSWEARVKPKLAAGLLNAAVQAGANDSGQIDWDLVDHNGLQAQAAAKALARAHDVAEQMAAGLKIKLGALIYASNEAPDSGPVRPMLAMAPAPMAKSAPPPLAIEPGKIRESASVYAVFAITD